MGMEKVTSVLLDYSFTLEGKLKETQDKMHRIEQKVKELESQIFRMEQLEGERNLDKIEQEYKNQRNT